MPSSDGIYKAITSFLVISILFFMSFYFLNYFESSNIIYVDYFKTLASLSFLGLILLPIFFIIQF